MTMLGSWLRSEDYLNEHRSAAREHACPTRALRQAHYQIEQFQRVWRDAFENVPFYAQWKGANGLPDRVASLDELESWPIVAKRDLQKDADLLVRSGLLHRPYCEYIERQEYERCQEHRFGNGRAEPREPRQENRQSRHDRNVNNQDDEQHSEKDGHAPLSI